MSSCQRGASAIKPLPWVTWLKFAIRAARPHVLAPVRRSNNLQRFQALKTYCWTQFSHITRELLLQSIFKTWFAT
ncbi:hypothetical protein EUGRSUZ_H04291 [Eucalyptus grandis]|uniref:Uncharacterized protein n=2 Tax=Eucalyptus grandis TaxID=71139 RepID=A0ACC3JWL7_EUCGR|nr:hypothetical protein EUGRSUZ_H04291 [Eucalyptus grandis]